MPPSPEKRPPGPRPPEKPPAVLTGKAAEIDKAKKALRDVVSRDESIRLEAIKNFRNPPLETLDMTKAALKIDKSNDWLVKSAGDIQYSPEVARFAAILAENPELAADPHWFLAKTVELAYSARADATADARREINQAIAKASERFGGMVKVPLEDIKPSSFQEIIYAGPVEGIVPIKKNVYKEDKPDEETITDPDLIRMLREVNYKIRTDERYASNPDLIDQDIRGIQQLAHRSRVPENQVKEALTRMQLIAKDARMKASEGRYVSWDEMKEKMLPEDRDEKDHDFQKVFSFRNITPAEVNLLKKGEEGQQEFFYEFVSRIYSMGRTPERAELPDMQKFEEFTDFIKWLYPDNTNYHLGKYEYMWREMPKHYQIVKNLLFTPGDIKDKLKNLQFLTPADMDHYIKNVNHANIALSLYEDVLFDVLSERQVKYKEALKHLKGKKGEGAIKDFKRLAKLRQEGRLSDPKDELEFQKLQEMVDLVGYGVNLWDSDIQNYMELDLEINEMNRELDRLRLKQKNWEARRPDAEKLTDWEERRLVTLQDEIYYKQNVAQDAKKIESGDSKGLKKSQHENRGLSTIDLEVKERLRISLQERIPGREIKDWELNQALWAARQWMIGSSTAVSISSGMAIRPNAEFNNLVKEVNGGKFVMKSPAFEDLQRVINPELFEARFGMGDTMGEVFRSFTDWDLMESKGYKFKNSADYRMPDEKDLDPTVRRTREFIRQVEAENGIPYSEMITQGFFQGGGLFHKSIWRAEIAAVDEMRKKYLDMQAHGKLPAGAKLDNQALGIQMLLKYDTAGKKELLTRMVKRNPGKLFHLLGEPVEDLYTRHGISDTERKSIRRVMSLVKVDAWDRTGQQGEKSNRPFRDIDVLTNEGDFNELMRPYLEKEGFDEGRVQAVRALMKDANSAFLSEDPDSKLSKADIIAAHDSPITYTVTDVDWKDASMFQTGTIGNDRRARDMGQMAVARDAWIAMHKPAFLTNRDVKETLKKLYEFREAMNNYTTGNAAENATYELAKAWLKFNENRMIRYENREGGVVGAVKGALRVTTGWIPLYHTIQKNLGEVDVSNSPLIKIARLQTGKGDDKHYVFGDRGKKFAHTIEHLPHKLAQDVSYSVRFGGPHGNAFEEKQFDEILDQMLQMGIFNANEGLYLQLRREFGAGLGGQIKGMVRKYWWGLPLLAVAFGAKEGLEEEKKR